MIKSLRFIDAKYSHYDVAGRAISDHAAIMLDQKSLAAQIDVNSKRCINVVIRANFVGLSYTHLSKLVETASQLPICFKANDEKVLLLFEDGQLSDEQAEVILATNDKSVPALDIMEYLGNLDWWLLNKTEVISEFNQYLQQELYSKAIESGVYIIDPNNTHLACDTIYGKNVVIEPNVYVGPGVHIGDNVTIRAFSYIEGAKIGNNTAIGPFARIRPNSQIGSDVKIGNFVEVKNSIFYDGAKASHLSYIGDSNIGQNVNIGAGVITCNYNGDKRHKTNIGDNTFVGTNTSLIAPISIGNDVLIGAGSFINRDIPDNSFAIGRSKQQVRPKKTPSK